MQAENVEPFVPVDDVAEHFSVSVTTIRAWVKSGQIPSDTYIKLGNTYRFRLGAIEQALLSNQAEATTKTTTLTETEEPVKVETVDFDDLDLDDL
jgi:excisionase family DNA binding protein